MDSFYIKFGVHVLKVSHHRHVCNSRLTNNMHAQHAGGAGIDQSG
jgi:hypothetical protein